MVLTKYKCAAVFPSEEIVIRRIVRAIQKAIEEDVPDFCHENHMETMNSIRYLRGDKINDNLRTLVVSDDIILISFKRYSWDGRIEKPYHLYNYYTAESDGNPKKEKPYLSTLFTVYFGCREW